MKEGLGLLIGIFVFFLVIVGFGFFINYAHNQNEKGKRDHELACVNSGKVWTGYECQKKYDWCLHKVRVTFQDLTDTVGVSQNHQDTVSVSMRHEIERCLEIK